MFPPLALATKYLSYKPHVDITLKKAYAKTAALRRIKRLVPSNVRVTLYKVYVLPHLNNTLHFYWEYRER